MTRMIRGSVLLAACAVLWSCASDPTADEAGKPYAIVASPAVMFVTQGQSELVEFTLVDQLNSEVPSSWSIGAPPAQFTVALDSSYRPVYNPDGSLVLPSEQTEVRATITGVTAGQGVVNVSAGGITLPVSVSVVPANVPATFNTTTPNIGQGLVLTMPAGILLLDDATFSTAGAEPPLAISRAPDGSSVTLLVAPGTNGPITIAGVTTTFADLDLTLSTTESIIATGTSDFTGTDAYATAPSVVPEGFYDLGTWGGAADCGLDCQIYKFTVPSAGTYSFSLTWSNDTDLGVYVSDGAGNYLADACDAHGNGGTAQPEACDIAFPTAGDWYIEVQSFGAFYGPDPNPSWIGLAFHPSGS